ncbi:hypothetical protein [Streptomyces noursei]
MTLDLEVNFPVGAEVEYAPGHYAVVVGIDHADGVPLLQSWGTDPWPHHSTHTLRIHRTFNQRCKDRSPARERH